MSYLSLLRFCTLFHLIIGFEIIYPSRTSDKLNDDDVAIIDKHGDLVLLSSSSKNQQPSIFFGDLQKRNDVPISKYPHGFDLPARLNSHQYRNRHVSFERNAYGRKACRTTPPKRTRLLFGISKNGSEVELKPGQEFMLTECETENGSCYGTNDIVSSMCSTNYQLQNAFVRMKGSDLAWFRDHIYVPTGCECRVSIRPKLSLEDDWQLEQ